MGLFPLTPDKLGSLICKRINRLTLFARARWHMELQPQKAGHTHGDTHVGQQLLIQDSPATKVNWGLFFFFHMWNSSVFASLPTAHLWLRLLQSSAAYWPFRCIKLRRFGERVSVDCFLMGPACQIRFGCVWALQQPQGGKEQDKACEFTSRSGAGIQTKGQRKERINNIWLSSSVIAILQKLPL